MTISIRIDAESDEYGVTSVEAVPPTWRDLWAILRGRYTLEVRKVRRPTVAGAGRAIREAWDTEALSALYDSPPLITVQNAESRPEGRLSHGG